MVLSKDDPITAHSSDFSLTLFHDALEPIWTQFDCGLVVQRLQAIIKTFLFNYIPIQDLNCCMTIEIYTNSRCTKRLVILLENFFDISEKLHSLVSIEVVRDSLLAPILEDKVLIKYKQLVIEDQTIERWRARSSALEKI